MMMFRDCFKLTGNKTYDDAVDAIMILWENYINSIPNAWSLHVMDAQFIFDVVMRNVSLNIGFRIDKIKLNSLLNRNEYKNNVFLSKYESTSDTHVNIKMFAEKPDDFEYNVLVYDKAGIVKPYFIQMKDAVKKKDKPIYITFIIFSSAKAIISGRYYNNMKELYEFFIETIIKHRQYEIEVNISNHKLTLSEYLETIF